MPKQTKDFVFDMPLVWYRTSSRGAKEPYHHGTVQIEVKGYKDGFGDYTFDLEDFKVTDITQVEFMQWLTDYWHSPSDFMEDLKNAAAEHVEKNWPKTIEEMVLDEDF